jgi:hypothetical protein
MSLEDDNAALRHAVETRLATTRGETTVEMSPMVASLAGCKPAMEAATRALSDGADPYSEWVPPDPGRRAEAVAGFRRIVEDARPAREARAAARVIGIAGRAGAGKSLVASMIPGAVVLEFADPLYEMISTMLGVSESVLRARDLKESPIPGVGKSVRYLLQTLGTEWGRGLVADDIWIRLLDRRIAELESRGVRTVVVVGVRFANESDYICSRGGMVWLVRRPGTDTPPTHESESGDLGNTPAVILNNEGTVDDLRVKVIMGLTMLYPEA